MNAIINKQAKNVAQNDIEEIALPKKPLTPAQVLAKLEHERIDWENGAYKASNKQLYALLAECLGYGGELSFADAKVRSAALDTFYKERGYRTKKDTPLMTRIVRAVFGDIDRRRISTYSLVLRAAKAAGVFPINLAAWIEERGGVQEIRMSRSPSFITPKQKVEIAQKSFEELATLATVKTDELAQLADADDVGTDCVLLATQMDDGSFAVKALLRGGVAVNAAFAALYAQKRGEQQDAEKQRKAANDADGAVLQAA